MARLRSLVLALTCVLPAWAFAGAPPATPSLARTIAHQILEAEGAVVPVPAKSKQLLDDVLTGIRKAVEAQAVRLGRMPERIRAEATLALIDSVLTENHFVYPARGYVHSVGEALRPVQVDAEGLERLSAKEENSNRKASIDSSRRASFHIADCDILSIIYVSAGEVIGAPLSLVDLPSRPGYVGHNYVRWTLGDGTFVNWETTSGRKRSPTEDDHFFSSIPKTRVQAMAERLFGVAMTRDEALAYGDLLVAGLWSRLGRVDQELAVYRRSLRKTPSPVPLNDVVWILATAPDPALRNPAEAVRLGKILRAKWSTADYLDTVAAAYASAGRWEDAIREQRAALSIAVTSDPKALGFKRRLAQYQKHDAYRMLRSEEQAGTDWGKHLQSSAWKDLRVVPADAPGTIVLDESGRSSSTKR
jgi:tetratricopeptide (TPR) repeat protein